MTIRRVITGHDENMKAVVIDDGPRHQCQDTLRGARLDPDVGHRFRTCQYHQ